MDFIDIIRSLSIDIQEKVSLSIYTSLKIGGDADYIAKPTTTDEIILLIKYAKQFTIRYFILGNGSNTLGKDEGFKGLIILLKDNFAKINKVETSIVAQAGALLWDICEHAFHWSLTGIEFAYGIPASVGGAMYMNAGAYFGEMSEVVESVTFIDENFQVQTYTADQLEFNYRHSFFMNKNCCIFSATFRLKVGDKTQIRTKMDELFQKRKNSQPLDYPSAGSTFKRPQGNYASALIDACGLRGYQIGGAQVSEKHTGFIINKHLSTSKDMEALIEHVQKIVYEQKQIHLIPEMRIIE